MREISVIELEYMASRELCELARNIDWSCRPGRRVRSNGATGPSPCALYPLGARAALGLRRDCAVTRARMLVVVTSLSQR